MKHIIILGDGMADHPVARLGGKTPLQYACTPNMDLLANNGCTGKLLTIPKGFHPGSEVANTSILGYDLSNVYEGRGPLEAASIGYDMKEYDLALRCNIITLENGKIKNHHGGHLSTQESDNYIKKLNANVGNDDIRFITGTQYRNLLIIAHGNKHVMFSPPHDHPDEPWVPLLAKAEPGWENKAEPGRMTGRETADLINNLIIASHKILNDVNGNEVVKNEDGGILSIWPWGGGYRPAMAHLSEMYPQIQSGSVISAVDLIKGIGRYAGLNVIDVEGATGLSDTNYEGKVEAAITALHAQDFVYLHIEASDEAGHDGDLDLKIRTIENLDSKVVGPIYKEINGWNEEPVCIAILPDHPTPVELRTHVAEPVPFVIWYPGIKPDNVKVFDEASCALGTYGLLHPGEFMELFMRIQ